MNSEDLELMAIDIDMIIEQIKPILAGHDPAVQGYVLCELTALWIARHQPDVRAWLVTTHTTKLLDMIPIAEKELFGQAWFPS